MTSFAAISEHVREKPVLLATDISASLGGPNKTMNQFAQAIDAQVISLGATGDKSTAVTYVNTKRFPFFRQYGVPASKNHLLRALAKAKLVSCHVLFRYPPHIVHEVYRKYDVPYWFVPHGILDPYGMNRRASIKKAWMNIWGKKFLRDANKVIFATEREREKALPWLSRTDNTVVIPWGVSRVNVDRATARKIWLERLSIKEPARILLFMARLETMKRPLETIRAFAACSCKELHLVVAGPEENVKIKECAMLAKELGVENRVKIIGPVFDKSEKAHLLNAVDGFISWSWRENFGHSAMEALAAGKPAILSEGHDVIEELKAIKWGWCVDNNDISSLRAAICDFAEMDGSDLASMGHMLMDYFDEKFSPRKLEKSLNNLMDTI